MYKWTLENQHYKLSIKNKTLKTTVYEDKLLKQDTKIYSIRLQITENCSIRQDTMTKAWETIH